MRKTRSLFKIVFLAAILFLGINASFAQNDNEITGTVKNGAGAPLAGALVTVQKTNAHAITTEEGSFAVKAP